MERRSLLRAAVLGGTSAALGGTLWRGGAVAGPAPPGPGPERRRGGPGGK
ncbi:translocation protein TolB, partial [Streptomyces chartreusis]